MFGQGVFLNTFFQKKHLYKFPKVQTESNDSACLHCCSFTGKEKDSETGFYYFGARYYDPTLSGLFLSVDPMSDKYPSLSPYAYCAWNPLKLVDPNGEESVCNEDGWIVNFEDKIITHISDAGGNQKQHIKSTRGFSFTYDMSVNDFRSMCKSEGYKIKESSSSKMELGLVEGSALLSVIHSSVINTALDNFKDLQQCSDNMSWGLDYTPEINKVNRIGNSLNKSGKLLGMVGLAISSYQLINDKNIEDKIYHSIDIIMGSIGMVPNPITTGMSFGWSVCGRQVLKAQSDIFQMQIDAGFNPGHCSFMPFK